MPFSANQKFFFCKKLYELHSKPFFTHKNFFCTCLSSLSAKISHFHKPKVFLLHKPFLLPPKATLFCPPSPILTTLNLLSAKNTAVLLLFALIPCAVKPERRTDSNHCRRYPEKCSFQHSRLPDERRSFQKKSRIDRRFESSPESRGSQTSGVLFGSFCTTQKERKNVPFAGSIEVLQTSNQHTAAAASHRNN